MVGYVFALGDQLLDCVGDLQFTPGRRANYLDGLVDRGRKKVHANQRQVALGARSVFLLHGRRFGR